MKAAQAASSSTVDYEVIYCINCTEMVTIWPLRSAAAAMIIPAKIGGGRDGRWCTYSPCQPNIG